MLNMHTNDNTESYQPPETGLCSQVQFSGQEVRKETDFHRDPMNREGESCAASQAFNNTGASPMTSAQWQNVSLNNGERGQKNDQSQGCPDTYENMITRMEDIEKTLAATKETATKASVRCHMLNVDVVTMFNPEMMDMLNQTVEQCENCIKRMESLSPNDS
ncbi:unnamed protein product [Porites evermanni]|uniref:Uncharacterized protein n=1 Tax=Porites evermanni TaxID=104178 RepID=A0ABN8NBM0_9CNID|nr:unnamed protein product [Porites evermanni]